MARLLPSRGALKGIFIWAVGNALWPSASTGFVAMVSIFIAKATGLQSPWVYLFWVSATLLGTALVLGLLRPALTHYVGPLLPWASDGLPAPTAPTTLPAANSSGTNLPPGWKTSTIRADLVFLGDELSEARKTLMGAHNDSRFWGQPISTSRWEGIRDTHLDYPGFHGPRAAVRAAYDAIGIANDRRLENEAVGDGCAMGPADRDELRGLIEVVVNAENGLSQFLDQL